MPFFDDSGKEVSPDDVRAHFQPPPDAPEMPSDVVEHAISTVGHIVPRVGTQVGGAELGGMAGAAVGGPVGAVIGAGIGGGIGNVVGSHLPQAIGGDPSEATVNQFLLGAVPEAGARGAANYLEKRAATKAAEAAHDAIVSALDKGPMPAEAAGQTASALGRTTLGRPAVLTGEQLSDATNSLRQTIIAPINAARRKLGEPIGAAYESLKGNTTPLDPRQLSDLQEATANVKDSMLAPYPKAKAIFQRIKNLSPPEPPSYIAKGQDRPISTDDFAELNKFNEDVKNYKPPTLDELRELRQVNNQMLRGAQGGDVHAALGLQQAIDEQLMPYLPAGISRDRELYRSFMNRFSWRDINKIGSMGTPAELGDYVFGSTPERAKEIITGASPQGKDALKQALIDRAMRANNPDLPLDQQVKAVRGALTEHVANGNADLLFGKQGADQLREVFYAPEHLQQMKQIISTPEARDQFVKETSALLRGDKNKAQAVERGFEKLIQSLPAPEQARFQSAPVPGAEMPVLPSDAESRLAGLTPGESRLGGRMVNRMQFTAPYAVGRAAMGSPGFAAAQLMAMAGLATTSAGYRVIMENGGASAMAKLYASPSGRAAARSTIELLVGLGTQSVNRAAK